MSNPCVKQSTNPIFLLEQIVRNKIFNNNFYKTQLFALDSETILEKAVELDHVGGVTGSDKHPTPFICMVLKLLKIIPSDQEVRQYLYNEDYKYLSALAAFFVRLAYSPKMVFELLEPFYADYRKLRVKSPDGKWQIIRFDEYIDTLLREKEVFEVVLPIIPKRKNLETSGELQLRKSVLADELKGEEEAEFEYDKAEEEFVASDDEQEMLGKKRLEPETESVDYWNDIRSKLGLKLLPKN